MDIKNAEFDADFDSIEKAAKNRMGKNLSTKKWKKNWAFYFHYCVHNFSVYNLLGWFLHFFQQIWTEHRILHFMVPISNIWEKKFSYISTFC